MARRHSSGRTLLPRLIRQSLRQSVVRDLRNHARRSYDPYDYTNNRVRPDVYSQWMYRWQCIVAILFGLGIFLVVTAFVDMLFRAGFVNKHISRLSKHWVQIS